MKIPQAAFTLVKEVARHVLRRPVVGVAAVARTEDGRILLIRRADSGTWALPGGTLEWGETLHTAVSRELHEEAGADLISEPTLLGVFSRPDRDPRFHAVTVLVACKVSDRIVGPLNPLEIREAKLFAENAKPPLALSGDDMLQKAENVPFLE